MRFQRSVFLGSNSFIYLNLIMLCFSFLMFWHYLPPKTRCAVRPYNNTQMTKPFIGSIGQVSHRFVIVTDQDRESKHGHKWQSYMKRGVLHLDIDHNKASVEWGADIVLTGNMASHGRSMELSDLVVFDGRLLTVDDRTGIVYQIDQDHQVIPWVFLNDGPGNTTKGFKAEWMTVKDEWLFVGGLGKEWTTDDGQFVNEYPMWVKRVSPLGEVQHLNWVRNYKSLRRQLGIEFPGYVIHESCQWSSYHKMWFFLPRRVSKDRYDAVLDEFRGSNTIIEANDDFSKFRVRTVAEISDGSRGFSGFQFVPGTYDDVIVAVKSAEKKGKSDGSYLTVFRISTGEILLTDTLIHSTYKFEGLTFA